MSTVSEKFEALGFKRPGNDIDQAVHAALDELKRLRQDQGENVKVKWIRVKGAHVSRVDDGNVGGTLVCVTFEPFSDFDKPFGVMTDEKTLREMGEGFLSLANQLRDRNQQNPPSP